MRIGDDNNDNCDRNNAGNEAVMRISTNRECCRIHQYYLDENQDRNLDSCDDENDNDEKIDCEVKSI